MEIRPYQPHDDDALMQIERQSARGFPNPFVHFRRSFIQRAKLYKNYHTVVAVQDDEQIGVSSIIVKDTIVGGEQVKIAYSFDTRVVPKYRRNGIGHALVEEKLRWAAQQGAVGVYSLIVTTNEASLGMVAKFGYEKIRMILYLNFLPYPLLSLLQDEPNYSPTPIHAEHICSHYAEYDLFVPDVADRLTTFDFQRWFVDSDDGKCAALSVWDQAKVYIQVPAEAPFPKTEEDIVKLGRNLQIFDVVGMQNEALLYSIVQRLRDEAIVTNVNKIIWLIDRSENIPAFVFREAAHQKDYWLMYKPFSSDGILDWSNKVYLDPRDL